MGPAQEFWPFTVWRAKRRLGSVEGLATLTAAARVAGRVLASRVRAMAEKCMATVDGLVVLGCDENVSDVLF